MQIKRQRRAYCILGFTLAGVASIATSTACSDSAAPIEAERETTGEAKSALTFACVAGQPCCGVGNVGWMPPSAAMLNLNGSAAESCLGEDADAFPGATPWSAPPVGICCTSPGTDGTCNGPGATGVGNPTITGRTQDKLTSITGWWTPGVKECSFPSNPVSCQLVYDNCAGTAEKTAVCDIAFKSTSTLSGSITAGYEASVGAEFDATILGCGGKASGGFKGTVSATGAVGGSWELDSTSHPSVTVPSAGCINGPSFLYPSQAKSFWFLPVTGSVAFTFAGTTQTFACNSRSLGGKATMVTKLYDTGSTAPLGQCASPGGSYDTSKFCGQLPAQGGGGGGGGGYPPP